jgi:periplasmic protein CpxP/Spy
MRMNFTSLALGTVLAIGLSGAFSLAQEQSQVPEANSGQTAPQGGAVNARPRHVPNPKRQARKMAKKLGLSADQQAQLEPILADRLQQLRTLRSDNSLTPGDRMAKVREVRQDTNHRIEAILNDTQKQQYEQMMQEQRARRQQRMQQPAGNPS